MIDDSAICWTGPVPGRLVRAQLDALEAVFDRQSGQTHLIAEPLPQIIDTLTGERLDTVAVAARLAAAFDLDDGDDSVRRIGECLSQLAALGLIEAG